MQRIRMKTVWRILSTTARGLMEPQAQTVMVVLTKTVMVRPISTMDGRFQTRTSKMNSQPLLTTTTTV